MPRKPTLPWFEYTGQTTEGILEAKATHRIDSLLCAIEEGLQAKSQNDLSGEESLVLAVMALNREVNNGGYSQFFINSSRQFVPIIVQALHRIGCDRTADLTARAIASRGHNDLLDTCDREFYQLHETEAGLFAFVEGNRDRIQLTRQPRPPRPVRKAKASNASRLYTRLEFAKLTVTDLDGIRAAARELAVEEEIASTDAEIDGAAVLYAFSRAVNAGDLAESARLAPRALELMCEDTIHCVYHRKWVEQLLLSMRYGPADAATLMYLEYLKTCDHSTLSTQNRILFWARILQQNREDLPDSVRFFKAEFPHEDLDSPLPAQRFTPKAIA